MLAKSISNFLNHKNYITKIIVIGSAMFLISDIMLLFTVFGDGILTKYLCLGLYYPAQFMLAMSLFIHAKEGNIDNKDIETLKIA